MTLAEDNGYRFAGVYSDWFADNTLGFLVSVAGDARITREDWFGPEERFMKAPHSRPRASLTLCAGYASGPMPRRPRMEQPPTVAALPLVFVSCEAEVCPAWF